MFATSTKTATFLLTCTPIRCGAASGWARRLPRSSRHGHGADGASDARTLIFESEAFPAGPLRRVVRLRRLDRRAALVRGRSKGLLDERLGHVIGIGRRIDDQQVDRPDVAARGDRGAD